MTPETNLMDFRSSSLCTHVIKTLRESIFLTYKLANKGGTTSQFLRHSIKLLSHINIRTTTKNQFLCVFFSDYF